MRVIVVNTDWTIEVKLARCLEDYQKLVGGYIEGVKIRDDLFGYVNEEGLIDSLPVNSLASKLCGRTIVGPLVIMGLPDQYGNETECDGIAVGYELQKLGAICPK